MNIVITGGSRGLGKAIAEKFAGDKQGHRLYLCARNRQVLEYTARELQVRFPRALIKTYTADFAKPAEVNAFAHWVLKETGSIDILVNNAGIFEPGSVHNEPEQVLERLMQVNMFSAYHLTRQLLPAMMKAGKGHIFNICSIASIKAYDNGGAYSISKFALLGFSRNLREEMKPHGIKVTAVMPGATYTDSWSSSGIDPSRFMEAQDIAEMIYVSSQLSAGACVEDIIMRPQLGDI
jgi:short-subunit dehydrogenase